MGKFAIGALPALGCYPRLCPSISRLTILPREDVLGPISVAKRIDEGGKEFEPRRDCHTKGETAVIAEIQNPCKSLTTGEVLERETRLELATSTLARLRFTSPNFLF
jgi:hypothetical protein